MSKYPEACKSCQEENLALSKYIADYERADLQDQMEDIKRQNENADCGSTHLKRNANSCLNFNGHICWLCQIGELEAQIQKL